MDILSKINTTDEIDSLVTAIDKLKTGLFTNKHYMTTAPEVIKEAYDGAVDKDAFLNDIRKELVEAKTLTMSVAAELPGQSVARIANWVKSNVGTDVVLELKIDSSLLAGTTITFNGKFKDYSFKEELVKALEKITL
jgi:hypothetical protein